MKYFKLLIFILVFQSSKAQFASDYSGDILHDYFGNQLEMIQITEGFSPPVVSRALGYSGLTAYEAAVHGIPDRESFVGVLPQLNFLPEPEIGETLHWGIVTNEAMYNVTISLYSNASSDLMLSLTELRDTYSAQYEIGTSLDVIEASEQFGMELSSAIIDFASGDGEDNCQLSNFPTDYVIPQGPGLWTPLDGQLAMQPYWGEKRCFVMEYIDESLISPAPPSFSIMDGSEMFLEAMAVYDAVENVTVEETNIAEYWADGDGSYTPPGHSVSMLRNIMIIEDEDLEFSAVAYARLGMALSDAFVACWKTKYEYNLIRPLQYIQENIDSEWETIVETPPFPEYTSGHSTQSGAWGAAMNAIYGENYSFVDSTYGGLYGGPRFYNNFTECAEETAISRLYGGIHYPIGNNAGSDLGILVGDMVNQLFSTTITSIPQLENDISLDLFPNPTTGKLMVRTSLDHFTIEIHSVTGGLLKVFYDNSQIDLSSFDSGLYLLIVKDEGGVTVASERVILEI